MTEDSHLVVLGAGLMRTGTNSLKLALEELTEGKCYTMFEILTNKKGPDARFMAKAVVNKIKYNSSGYTAKEWKDFYSGYSAAVDHPTCVFFDELMEVYPEAKIILTERDPRDWIKSVRKTTMNPLRQGLFIRIQKWLDGLSNYFTITDGVRSISLGDINMDNDDEMMVAFVRWNDYVKNTVPPERLLVMRSPFEWGPICDFLGKPVPTKRFPHVNTVSDFHSNVIDREQKAIRKIKISLGVGVTFILIILVSTVLKY